MNIIYLIFTLIRISHGQEKILFPLELRTSDIKLQLRIDKALNDKSDRFEEDFSKLKEKPTANGLQLRKLKIYKGRVHTLYLNTEAVIGKYELPEDTVISFSSSGESVVTGIDSVKKRALKFNGLLLKRGLMIKDGQYPAISFSGILQKSNDKDIYENQPIIFDKNGEVESIDYILHYGKKYYYKDIQKEGRLPIEPFYAAFNKYSSYVHFFQKSADMFLGNNCVNCLYVTCRMNDHFYVYHIDGVIDGSSKIQSVSADSKRGRFYYYRNGNSAKPFIDEHDESVPFKEDCSFEPSEDLSPDRVKSLKNY